jgi:hypothetical protein
MKNISNQLNNLIGIFFKLSIALLFTGMFIALVSFSISALVVSQKDFSELPCYRKGNESHE